MWFPSTFFGTPSDVTTLLGGPVVDTSACEGPQVGNGVVISFMICAVLVWGHVRKALATDIGFNWIDFQNLAPIHRVGRWAPNPSLSLSVTPLPLTLSMPCM